jgi:hypothetical protein
MLFYSSMDTQTLPPTPAPRLASSRDQPRRRSLLVPGTLRSLVGRGRSWAVIPLLAMAAYLPVLRIGFLADDFLLLSQGKIAGLGLATLLPDPHWFFYRPLGKFLTWQLGWVLWGYNPLPYHVVGLLLHAGTALMLALWLTEVTGRRGLGWWGGALFAVFPLHLEAAGWLAAQWDAWAAFFGLASLWQFMAWWQCPAAGRRPYLLALLLYGLAVFSKESVIPLLPLFAGAVWASGARLDRAAGRRLLLALLPFAVVLALNLGLRWLTWGNVGGYADLPIVDPAHVGEQLIVHVRALLTPINTTVFSPLVGQIVGALSSLGLVAGILLFGRRAWRLLLLVAAWVGVLLLPILNLGLGADDLQQNRFLYLPAAGYCAGVAALFYHAFLALRLGRRPAIVLGVVLLGAGLTTCWIQLQPWHTATAQVDDLDGELARLIPSQPRPQGMLWYVENLPDSYRGAYLLRLGLGGSRLSAAGDVPGVVQVDPDKKVSLLGDPRDVFALRLVTTSPDAGYHVAAVMGLTAGGPPPARADGGADFQLWDFQQCDAATLGAWQFNQNSTDCRSGGGLLLRPSSPDPQLIGPDLAVNPAARGARFVRLRILVRYPSVSHPLPYLSEWFWHGPAGGWSAEQSRSLPIVQDGTPHIYWTFLPVAAVGPTLAQLRFDPVNAAVSCQIGWIALDLVR